MHLSFRPLALEHCQKATVLKQTALQEFSHVTPPGRVAIKLTGGKKGESKYKYQYLHVKIRKLRHMDVRWLVQA